jgi:hypothetical protein
MEQERTMVVRRLVLLRCVLVFVHLAGVVAPAAATLQCPMMAEPAGFRAFPGTTNFNNTVRAQMWIVDNTWWGAFSDGSSGLYFYKREGNKFVKGAFIDKNFTAGAPDTLWNGVELFVLVYKSGSSARLYKYVYSLGLLDASQAYTLVPGFPVDLRLAGLAEDIALQQDSRGKLWATYTSGRNVHVIWSTSLDHRTWDTNGMILASDIDETTSEASTIVHFSGNKIGVVWGSQVRDEIAFRFRTDGDPETWWSAKEIVDCCQGFLDEEGELTGIVSDDHLSLRAAPDGRLFLIAKDGFEGPGGFLEGRVHLYIRNWLGGWGQKTIVDPDPDAAATRPVLALDSENHHAYVVYRESVTNAIYVTRSPLDSPGFDPRCLFIANPEGGGRVTNPTSTKQNVNGATDLVAVAGRSGGRPPVPLEMFANVIDLESTGGPLSFLTGSHTLEATTTVVLNQGEPAAEFEVIWDGRVSASRTATSSSQWTWLRGKGVSTVVNLDGGMYDLGRHGFDSFLWVRLAAGAAPTNAQAKRFVKFIQKRNNQPAHISSAARDGRATMVALLRYAVDGWTIESALAEGQRINGGVALSAQQVQWLLSWASTHLPGSLRLGTGLTVDATLSGTTSTVDSTLSATSATESPDSTLSTTTTSTTSTVESPDSTLSETTTSSTASTVESPDSTLSTTTSTTSSVGSTVGSTPSTGSLGL